MSRATIDRAIKSGKLAAEKDAEGSWRISPHALTEAGFNPSKPPPLEDAAPRERAEDAPVPAEVARLRVELVQAQLDGERRLREAVERQLVDVVRERDQLLHRQLEAPAAPAPVAPSAPPQSAPMPTPTPDPARQPQGNTGKWRRAWNAIKYG